MKVKVLNKEVYELIAAGEVITRPEFVVKELVENSIDAGAKQINVHIMNGGKSLIRVVDDGEGMSFSDCKLAFLRHATSKIQSEADLNFLQTLGFRGEALASICAVSEVEVLTKQKNSKEGTHYFNSAGKEQFCEKVVCDYGTNIKISRLFYNVPARLKFLKSDTTEANLIQNILERLAISHSEISFSFKKNNKKIFQTRGNGSLADSIYNIFGKDFFKTLIPVNNIFSGIQVEGFVSAPRFCKTHGNLNISFANNRYIKSKIIKNGVEQAFEGFSMVGKSPYFILFLKLPSSDLDVNVHPAKIEVRFAKESEILKAIYLATKKAIDLQNDVFNQFYDIKKPKQTHEIDNNNINKKDNNNNFENYYDSKNALIECGFKSEVKPYYIDNKDSAEEFNTINFNFSNSEQNEGTKNATLTKAIFKEQVFETQQQHKQHKTDKTSPAHDKINKTSANLKLDGLSNLKLIGEVFKTYILAEFENKFIVVDKHAAHERIIYEKLKNEFNNFDQQILIEPLNIPITSNIESNLILENLEHFKCFGFDVEHFGNHNFLIRAVPSILKEQNCLDVFNEIVANLKLHKFDSTPQTIEKILHTMACKAAITANCNNSNEQLYELIKNIYFNENIRTCPHGRPAILVFSKERFDENFKRS